MKVSLLPIVAIIAVSSPPIIAEDKNVTESTRAVFLQDADSTTHYIKLAAPNSLAGDYDFVLPAEYGDTGQVLGINGSGELDWLSTDSTMNGAGQMIYGGEGGTPTALPAGSSGQLLISGGTGAPSWTDVIPAPKSFSAATPTVTIADTKGSLGTDDDISFLDFGSADVSNTSGIAARARVSSANSTGSNTKLEVSVANGGTLTKALQIDASGVQPSGAIFQKAGTANVDSSSATNTIALSDLKYGMTLYNIGRTGANGPYAIAIVTKTTDGAVAIATLGGSGTLTLAVSGTHITAQRTTGSSVVCAWSVLQLTAF